MGEVAADLLFCYVRSGVGGFGVYLTTLSEGDLLLEWLLDLID
jgi:hypothetical protein